MEAIEGIRERFRNGEYAISDHAIMEARKDGIEPQTVEKLEGVVLHGKVIEEYPERFRLLLYTELDDLKLPVHVVVDYSVREEPVIVTCYVPESQQWVKFRRRKPGKR